MKTLIPTLIAALAISLAVPPEAFSAVERQISVSGNCVRKVTPDRGSITLTAEYRNNDLKAATRDATQAYERVKANVRRLNLENLELKTTEYSVQEVREWEKERTVLKGFRVRMGLEVSTSNIDRIGEIIAAAAREEIKDVGQLRTYLSDELELKEHMECLKTAAENARAKAEKLAAALHAKVGEALSVSETAQEPPPRPIPMMAMAAEARGKGMAPPAVEPGQRDLALTVNVTFALK